MSSKPPRPPEPPKRHATPASPAKPVARDVPSSTGDASSRAAPAAASPETARTTTATPTGPAATPAPRFATGARTPPPPPRLSPDAKVKASAQAAADRVRALSQAAARRGKPAPVDGAPPAWASWIPPRVFDRLREYALLTRQDRPIGWLLLLWPTYWGLWLAAQGRPAWGTLVIFTLGVIVMRSAGCVINDWADRWLDPQVQRTRERPIAAGRVTPREALVVFVVLIAIALGLVLLTNVKTIALSGVAVVLAIVYPFVKRHSFVPQLWLGAAFGMAIPMAFTAVTDAWPPAVAWLAFAANILWSTAYDTFYAMVDRDDDLRAGARSTAILFGDLDLVAIGVIDATFVLAMALVGSRAGLGQWYWISLGVAVLLFAWQLWRARRRDREGSFSAFLHNHWVGFVLFVGIAADYAWRPAVVATTGG